METDSLPGDLEPQSLREELCFPFLARSQSPDGGWPYRLGNSSSVEPTCWALLALGTPPSTNRLDAIRHGCNWLRRVQHADGSWPAYPGQPEGCWVTALACLALQGQESNSEAVGKGMKWLCETWPAEASLWWRLQHRLFIRRKRIGIRQNPLLRGWSWTLGTSSWVEPTAYALLLLRHLPRHTWPRKAARRWQMGEELLYDRMCLGGGWNAGNPMVYGVAGEPQMIPTVWALLALQDSRQCPENRRSLQWVERTCADIRAPASLALAHLCLQAYERPVPPLAPAIREWFARNQFLGNVVTAAWVALALGPAPRWLSPRSPQ